MDFSVFTLLNTSRPISLYLWAKISKGLIKTNKLPFWSRVYSHWKCMKVPLIILWLNYCNLISIIFFVNKFSPLWLIIFMATKVVFLKRMEADPNSSYLRCFSQISVTKRCNWPLKCSNRLAWTYRFNFFSGHCLLQIILRTLNGFIWGHLGGVVG